MTSYVLWGKTLGEIPQKKINYLMTLFWMTSAFFMAQNYADYWQCTRNLKYPWILCCFFFNWTLPNFIPHIQYSTSFFEHIPSRDFTIISISALLEYHHEHTNSWLRFDMGKYIDIIRATFLWIVTKCLQPSMKLQCFF